MTQLMDIEKHIGKPFGIRHHYSGVWLGIVKGEGVMPHLLEIEGRRVWSWEGGRLEFSELCRKGLDSGRDRVGVWTTTQIPIGSGDHLVELTFDVSEQVIADVKAMQSANQLG